MTNHVGSSGVSREDLALFFDGELTGAEAQELGAQVEADPELGAELEQLGLLRGLVSQSLEAKATAVPQARFEQIWDEIDRAIDREARERDAVAGPQSSIWARMWAALKPVRMPLAVAAGAAAVAIVAFNVGAGASSDPSVANKDGGVASVNESATEKSDSAPAKRHQGVRTNPTPDPDMLAQAPNPAAGSTDDTPAELDLPKPKKVEAEIHGVEFSGKAGRISNTGTVTVLYVEEDVEPKDSERSL